MAFGEFDAFTEKKISCVTSFRTGGVSSPPYVSLNMGLHTGDNRENVLENRRRFFCLVNIPAERIVTLKQVHGSRVIRITEKEAGRGANDYEDSVGDADGMVTGCPGVPLVIFTADCMPVVLADPVKRVIGLAHAGWKGTSLRIAEKCVEAMKGLGGGPENIIAGLGPAVGVCCYEVKKDVKNEFNHKYIETKNKKYYLDLEKINASILSGCGIPEGNIIQSRFCTSCHSDLCYSYRREGTTGRMATAIMLWE